MRSICTADYPKYDPRAARGVGYCIRPTTPYQNPKRISSGVLQKMLWGGYPRLTNLTLWPHSGKIPGYLQRTLDCHTLESTPLDYSQALEHETVPTATA